MLGRKNGIGCPTTDPAISTLSTALRLNRLNSLEKISFALYWTRGPGNETLIKGIISDTRFDSREGARTPVTIRTKLGVVKAGRWLHRSYGNPVYDTSQNSLRPPIVKTGCPGIGVSDEILNILQWHTLRQQVGDRRDPVMCSHITGLMWPTALCGGR
jgi:hypothetical protein